MHVLDDLADAGLSTVREDIYRQGQIAAVDPAGQPLVATRNPPASLQLGTPFRRGEASTFFTAPTARFPMMGMTCEEEANIIAEAWPRDPAYTLGANTFESMSAAHV